MRLSKRVLAGVAVVACLAAVGYVVVTRHAGSDQPVIAEPERLSSEATPKKRIGTLAAAKEDTSSGRGLSAKEKPVMKPKLHVQDKCETTESPGSFPVPPEEGYPIPPVTERRLSSFVNPNLDLRDRIPADIATRVPEVTGKDVKIVVSILKNNGENDVVRNEAANLLRRSRYSKLTDSLIEMLGSNEEGERFRAYCIQHLEKNSETAKHEEKEKIQQTIRSALKDRHIAVRREALLSLVNMRDPAGEEWAVRMLRDDEGKDIRDLAIRCVKLRGKTQCIPKIREYLRDQNEAVRIAAIVALSEWKDEESVDAFKAAADSQSARLRRAGERALACMGLDRKKPGVGKTLTP